jgi:Ni/Co efflux regulator RcnB
MKRILSIAVAVSFLAAGLAGAAEAPAKPVVLKGEKQGEVTFKHETHKAQACTVCHADDKGGKIAAMKEQKSAHAVCQECHKKDAAKKAPTKCTECHAKKT